MDIYKSEILSIIIFIIGIWGIYINKRNILIIMMGIEIMILAINIKMISYSIYIDDIKGEINTIYILTVAAAEAAIGLAIIVAYYKISGNISLKYINKLKG